MQSTLAHTEHACVQMNFKFDQYANGRAARVGRTMVTAARPPHAEHARRMQSTRAPAEHACFRTYFKFDQTAWERPARPSRAD